MRRHSGMTLLELLITLTVSSIALGFGVTGWQNALERHHATTAINRLAISIREARHLALTQRKVITICPSTDRQHCIRDWDLPLIIFSGNPADGSMTILREYPANSQGKTTWRSFRQEQMLQMNVNGLTLAHNGTFIYCPKSGNTQRARALVLNKSGRTRVAEDLNGDGIVDINTRESINCDRRG